MALNCSDCFRLEQKLPGGACAHLETPPQHGTHPTQSFASMHVNVWHDESSDHSMVARSAFYWDELDTVSSLVNFN